MRVLQLLVVVSCLTLAIASDAAPGPAELQPLIIPSSEPASSRLAKELRDACDSIMSHPEKVPAVTAATFSNRPLEDWQAALLAAGAARKAYEDAKAAVLSGHKNDAARKVVQDAAEAESNKANATLQSSTQAANDAVAALRDACLAITGTKVFTKDMLDSLRAFASAPHAATELVKAFMLEAIATTQSLDSMASLLPTGALAENLVAGLAEFVYKRAKAEALAYVAKRLEKVLCSADRQPLFPHVCVVFADLDVTLPLSAIGSYLATAARADLERLPDALIVYALDDLTTHPAGTCADVAACDALVTARVALTFYDEVVGGRRALDVVRSLHRIEFTPLQKTQGPNAISQIRLASQLVDAVMRQEGWERLASGDTSQLPFFAISTLLTLEDLRNGWKLTVAMLNAPGVGLMRQIVSLVQRAAELHKRMEAVVKAIETPATAAGDMPFEESEPKAAAASRGDIARTASATLLAAADVTAAVAPLLGVVKTDALTAARRIGRLGESIASGEARAQIAIEVQDLYVRIVGRPATGKAAELLAKVRAALPILSQLARAESADEVVKVLEAAAAPVGAYEQKAQEHLTSVTAFAGVAIGPERITNQWGVPFGLFAPVGIHASWPSKDKKNNVGVMLSIVNLGNLVSERLDSELKSGDMMVAPSGSDKLIKVVSPGIFGTASVSGPFSLGFGAQFVPSAREVTTTSATGETTVTDRAAFQILVFAGIDVTIFPF